VPHFHSTTKAALRSHMAPSLSRYAGSLIMLEPRQVGKCGRVNLCDPAEICPILRDRARRAIITYQTKQMPGDPLDLSSLYDRIRLKHRDQWGIIMPMPFFLPCSQKCTGTFTGRLEKGPSTDCGQRSFDNFIHRITGFPPHIDREGQSVKALSGALCWI
jgi:hypothetical protein